MVDLLPELKSPGLWTWLLELLLFDTILYLITEVERGLPGYSYESEYSYHYKSLTLRTELHQSQALYRSEINKCVTVLGKKVPSTESSTGGEPGGFHTLDEKSAKRRP